MVVVSVDFDVKWSKGLAVPGQMTQPVCSYLAVERVETDDSSDLTVPVASESKLLC